MDCEVNQDWCLTKRRRILTKWVAGIGEFLMGTAGGNLIITPIIVAVTEIPKAGDLPSRWGLIQTALVWAFAVSLASVWYQVASP